MDGVTILNTFIQRPGGYLSYRVLGFVAAISAIGTLFLSIVVLINLIKNGDFKATCLLIPVSFIVCLVLSILSFNKMVKFDTPISYYQVSIDDTVSFNGFMDKYEIIDQEGKIYTVTERKD